MTLLAGLYLVRRLCPLASQTKLAYRLPHSLSGLVPAELLQKHAAANFRAIEQFLGSIDETLDATQLSDLSDVDVSTQTAGDFLRFNGSTWVDSPIQASDIASLAYSEAEVDALIAGRASDAELAALQGELDTHEALTTSAHGGFYNVAAIDALIAGRASDAELAALQAEVDADEAALAAHLSDTSDAHDANAIGNLTTTVQAVPVGGDASGTVGNITIDSEVIALDDLSDVNTTGQDDGNVLAYSLGAVWNESEWDNATWTSAGWYPATLEALSDASYVNVTGDTMTGLLTSSAGVTAGIIEGASAAVRLTAGLVSCERATAANGFIASAVAGDATHRFLARVDGTLTWGDGSATRDTGFERSAASVLKMLAGDKWQQNAAPTVGDDLTNRTFVDLRAAEWKTIDVAQGTIAAGSVVGTPGIFSRAGGAMIMGTGGALNTIPMIRLDPADYGSYAGKTLKMRVVGTCLVNNVAPTSSFGFRIFPIATVGGAAGVVTGTFGASPISGTEFATPAANSMTPAVSATINFPTADQFMLGMSVATATVAANSMVHFTVSIQVRWE